MRCYLSLKKDIKNSITSTDALRQRPSGFTSFPFAEFPVKTRAKAPANGDFD